MAGKRKGRQEPTVWSTLPYRKSLYKEAVCLYEESGNTVLKWQKNIIKDLLAVNKKGQYVHRKYGLAVSRRNGKTEIFLMRELYALKHGEKVLHTAHLTATSFDAAARLAEALDKAGYIEVVKKKQGDKYTDKHFIYRKQFGMEVIQILRLLLVMWQRYLLMRLLENLDVAAIITVISILYYQGLQRPSVMLQ